MQQRGRYNVSKITSADSMQDLKKKKKKTTDCRSNIKVKITFLLARLQYHPKICTAPPEHLLRGDKQKLRHLQFSMFKIEKNNAFF